MNGVVQQQADYLIFITVTVLGLLLLRALLPRLPWRLRLPAEVWVFCIALLAAGWFAVQLSASHARTRYAQVLTDSLPPLAEELNLLGLASLSPATPPDAPIHDVFDRALRGWMRVNPGTQRVSLFQQMPDGSFFTLLSARPPGTVGPHSPAPPKVGHLLATPPEELHRALATNSVVQNFAQAPAHLSAWFPVRLNRGLPPIVAEVDYSSSRLSQDLSSARFSRILSLAVIMLLVGGCLFAISIMRDDLAALRLAEEKLRTSEDRLLLHFQQAPLALMEFTPDGEITGWNPAAEEIFGFTAREIIGSKFYDFLLPSSERQEVISVVQEILLRTGGTHHINRNLTKSGRAITCEWHNTPLVNSKGKVIGVTSVAQDITERLRLEDELRVAQKIQTVGRLAAGIAHDFNNILTIIQGRSDLLRERKDLPPQAAADVDHIAMAAERAADLTRQLLTFSRRQVMFPGPLDLNEVIRSVAAMLNRTLSKEIELHCELAPNLPLIQADRGMIGQLVMNLALNSSDAMPGGGTLTISTEVQREERLTAPDGGVAKSEWCLKLEVTDTGTGMDAEKLSHIFEPFFTTKEVGKGPGLGLSVVHGIVEEHKATIEVSSKLGRGTTVAVYFPTQAVQPTSNASEVPAILFVEDEEAVRRAVTGTLERGGFEVLEAANAHEAQQQWQQNSRRISLVIADVVLPQGLNGRTLAEQIQGTHPETIFLFISGYREEVAIPGLSAARRQYFLQKPFTPREVLETVQRLLAENIVAPLASLPS